MQKTQMTQQTVTINGHTYLMTYDDQGNLVGQEARDPVPVESPVLSTTDVTTLNTLMTKATSSWALNDISTALLLILKKLSK